MTEDDFALTWPEAASLVRTRRDAFAAADLPAIAAFFAEDAVARFADSPELRGRPAIMAYLTARFEGMRDYTPEGTLQLVMGNRLAATWTAVWTDAATGRKMVGRGVDIWVLRGRQITAWDAAYNGWPAP